MNDGDAQQWLVDQLDVSRETLRQLDQYAELVKLGSNASNLVGPNSLLTFWERHIVDSAQLVIIARSQIHEVARWVDIGSGAGIPGLVTAILTRQPTTLIEPRRLRAQFLMDAVNALKLRHVIVMPNRVQGVRSEPFSVLTARAVAALPKLIGMSRHLADKNTLWLLPKGRSAVEELASLPAACQGEWRVEPSVTAYESGILVGRNVGSDRYL